MGGLKGGKLNRSNQDKNHLLGGKKNTGKLTSVASKKTVNNKTAHATSIQTPVSFNSHKRRRPVSLQNSPVDPRNEKNILIQPLPPKQFQEGKVSDDCHAESSIQAQGANA
ncbi:hypothetical protein PIB30_113684, partial [Stylosanthes scabra]|nr:hypothetical protein [Stylosanthes scabra]